MADFKALLAGLRQAEAHFQKQLAGIREALSSLEFELLEVMANEARGRRPKTLRRKRRHVSAATRAKIAAAQKKRWAKQKGSAKN